MPKRGRHPRRGGRTTPKGTRPPTSTRSFARDSEPDIVRDARAALREGPVAVLLMASGLVETTTSRPHDHWGRAPQDSADLGGLLESFVESEFKPLHALGAATLPMIGDELLRRRLQQHRRIVGVTKTLSWLETIDRPAIDGVVSVSDILGDGESILIGVCWPSGVEMTAVVYIDHNMGTIVKDAYVLPERLDVVAARYETLADEPGGIVDSVDPADARERIREAIAHYEITIPPIENDEWPMCRPLLELVTAQLPEGGVGFEYQEWSDDDNDQLAGRFLQSSFASELRTPKDVAREIADDLIWLAAGSFPGDPLRWSPVVVEVVLVDLGPRKIEVAKEDLRHVPEVLAAFVRFAHSERQIPPERTAETLEAVARWTPDFMDIIAGPIPTPEQNAARLARIAAGLDPDDLDDDFLDYDWDVEDFDIGDYVDEYEELLFAELGGPAAAAALDDEPLPDEPFDWTGVADSERQLVAEVLANVDRVCDELLDVEMRTICRHYLAALLRSDTPLFERSQRTDLIGGGVVWAAVRLQLGYGRSHLSGFPRVMLKDIAECLGVAGSSLSQRATSIESTLRFESDVLSRRIWHSAKRRSYLQQLASIERWRAEGEP